MGPADPWAVSTGTGSGAVADFGFAGHYLDRATELDLTKYRGKFRQANRTFRAKAVMYTCTKQIKIQCPASAT